MLFHPVFEIIFDVRRISPVSSRTLGLAGPKSDLGMPPLRVECIRTVLWRMRESIVI